ncbi:protein DEK [Entamoeba marina]
MQRRTRRERKAPERLVATTSHGAERYKGNGVVIGTSKILREKIEDAPVALRTLVHRLMYGRQGNQSERLQNILAFCGFDSDNQSERAVTALSKRTDEEVNSLADLFLIDETDRKEQESLIIGFFKEPKRPNNDEEVEFVEEEEEEKEEDVQYEESDDDEEVYDEAADDMEEEEFDDDDDDEESAQVSEESSEILEDDEDDEAELDNVYEEVAPEKKSKKPRAKKTKEKKTEKKKAK